MTPSDDPDQARIRRRLKELLEDLESLRIKSQEAGVECQDLANDWEDRITEQWGHQ